MPYTKKELMALGANLQNLSDYRKKIVDISVFDYVDDISLTDKVKGQLEYTLELYQEYLDLLQSFSKTNLEAILKGLRNTEVIDNHVVEHENYDWLKAYQENHHSTAINYLIKRLFVLQEPLNPNILNKAHEILMRGTSNEDDILLKFRQNNEQYVGYCENKELVVEFLPIAFQDIKLALNLFCDYYNQHETDEDILYVKPFIVHGLLASLQLFEDGNTRVARSIQHIKMFEVTRELFQIPFTLPALYFSKTYMPYRKEYRDFICKIALEPTVDTWNEWIAFNLRKVQDQIFFNESNLSRTRKI